MKKLFFIYTMITLITFVATSQIKETTSSESVMGGEYFVANNVWGATTAQKLAVDLSSTYFKVILSQHNQADVAAYPFIWKGSHWGSATTKNNPMPKKLKEIGTAPFTWSIDTTGVTGTWDAAFECWIDDVPASTSYVGELMIWINYGGDAGPAGGVIDTVEIGGYTWHVFFYLMGTPAWNYIAYKIATPVDSVSLDLKDFLHDALTKGYLKTSWYLANMEAGFEIWRNGQGLTTYSYSANVTTGNSLDVNYPPAPFTVVYPANNQFLYTLTSLAIPFSWNASNDPNSDPLEYTFHLYGPNIDTTINQIDSTSLLFKGSGILQYFTNYYWQVKATDGTDTIASAICTLKTARKPATGVNETEQIPGQFSLDQNYPNPFNPTTNIGFRTNISGHVILKVHDVLGREMASLLNEEKSAGIYSMQWDATTVNAGVYFYRLFILPSTQFNGKETQIGSLIETKKMLLIK
jgi:hypothetical protein